MKKTIVFHPLFLACVCTILLISPLQSSSQWKLIWSDEFKKEGLPDPAKWDYDIGGNGWGNNELEYYTKEAVSLDSNLIINLARKLGMSARTLTREETEDWELAQKIEEGLKTDKISKEEVMKFLRK